MIEESTLQSNFSTKIREVDDQFNPNTPYVFIVDMMNVIREYNIALKFIPYEDFKHLQFLFRRNLGTRTIENPSASDDITVVDCNINESINGYAVIDRSTDTHLTRIVLNKGSDNGTYCIDISVNGDVVDFDGYKYPESN